MRHGKDTGFQQRMMFVQGVVNSGVRVATLKRHLSVILRFKGAARSFMRSHLGSSQCCHLQGIFNAALAENLQILTSLIPYILSCRISVDVPHYKSTLLDQLNV